MISDLPIPINLSKMYLPIGKCLYRIYPYIYPSLANQIAAINFQEL